MVVSDNEKLKDVQVGELELPFQKDNAYMIFIIVTSYHKSQCSNDNTNEQQAQLYIKQHSSIGLRVSIVHRKPS